MTPLVITLIILGVALVLLLSDRAPADLVGMLVVLALGATRVLTPQEAFSGFSSSAVVIIFAIFILAEGLTVTGVTHQMGEWLLRVGGVDERRLVIVVMVAGAVLSLFMNNIAAAAVLLPAVSGAARQAGVSPSRLLLPLAFATTLGGMATLFTTSNIVISGFLRDSGYTPFGVLDFAPLGIPVVITGVAFMALYGRRLLPNQSPSERYRVDRPQESDLIDVYGLGKQLFRARVPHGSILINRPLSATSLRQQYHVTVVAVERDGQGVILPTPDTRCQEGDIITLQGDLADFRARDTEPYLDILPARQWRALDLAFGSTVIIEAVLAPRSNLIGQTLAEVHFRERYGMNVLAIWRSDQPIVTQLADARLQFGDALLLRGPRPQLAALGADPDLIVLRERVGQPRLDVVKARLALGTLLVAIVVATLGWLATSEAMLAGAVVMIVSGIMSMERVYRSVEWRSIFLVAGILPLGFAMTKTGAANLIATELFTLLGPWGPYALLIGLYVLTVLLTQAMGGQVVGAVVAPIALGAALQMGANPRALAMAVAFASSMAFLTPVSHAVNVLVMGSGGYQARDYARVGVPLTLLLSLVVLTLLPLLWPLYPH